MYALLQRIEHLIGIHEIRRTECKGGDCRLTLWLGCGAEWSRMQPRHVPPVQRSWHQRMTGSCQRDEDLHKVLGANASTEWVRKAPP